MKTSNKNERGFTVLEIFIIIVILGVVGLVGWFVYNSHKKSDKSTTTSTQNSTTAPSPQPVSQTPNPSPVDVYAGWKTFTMPVEKLGFKYPSNWTVTNKAFTATQEETTVTSPDGFALVVGDGLANGGDYVPLDSGSAVPIKYIGHTDYLVPVWARVPNPNGPSGYSKAQVKAAVLLTKPSDQTAYPLGKTAVGPNDSNGAKDAKYIQISTMFKSALTPSEANKNLDFNNAKLIIKSMHY